MRFLAHAIKMLVFLGQKAGFHAVEAAVPAAGAAAGHIALGGPFLPEQQFAARPERKAAVFFQPRGEALVFQDEIPALFPGLRMAGLRREQRPALLHERPARDHPHADDAGAVRFYQDPFPFPRKEQARALLRPHETAPLLSLPSYQSSPH